MGVVEVRRNKKYEGIKYNVVYMIKMFWDNLVHTVKGEYMIVLKEHRKSCIRKGEKFVKYGGQYLSRWMNHMKIVGIMLHHVGYSLLQVLFYFKDNCEDLDSNGRDVWCRLDEAECMFLNKDE